METALRLLLAGWMAQAAAAALLLCWYLFLLRRRQPAFATPAPPVLVVVPVRGAGPGLAGFLAGLAAQRHAGPWRMALVVESQDDPAWEPLARFAAAHPGRATLRVAGPARGRGQKVQNLLAGLDELRSDDAALVTLDADILPPPDLLSRLLRPVLSVQAPISSGYRWSLPGAGTGPAAALVALADMGFATLPRCARCNLCWGGATAIGRAALDRLDLRRAWDRTLSDDLALTAAAREAGLLVYAPLDVRPPGEVPAGDSAAALGFAARQFRILRLHAPRAWALGLLASLLPVAGGASALVLAAEGSAIAALCLAAAFLLQRLRARLRGAIAGQVLEPGAAAAARAVLRRWWLQPAVPATLLACQLAGGLGGRRLAWAGRRYSLDTAGRVTRVERR